MIRVRPKYPDLNPQPSSPALKKKIRISNFTYIVIKRKEIMISCSFNNIKFLTFFKKLVTLKLFSVWHKDYHERTNHELRDVLHKRHVLYVGKSEGAYYRSCWLPSNWAARMDSRGFRYGHSIYCYIHFQIVFLAFHFLLLFSQFLSLSLSLSLSHFLYIIFSLYISLQFF